MITIEHVVEAAPPDVRETLDEGTVAYLGTVIEGKSDPDDVRKALAPFLGMSSRDLDTMFAKLSLGPTPPPSAAASDPSSLLADVAARPQSPAKGGRKKRTPTAPAGPSVQAYSQQSRFHSATLSTLSTEIDLRGVNVTVDDTEILVDARLWLKSGVHYGLVGRNGAGKSTLLSVIGDHSLIGFPENIRTLYVQQLDVMETEDSVLSTVLMADEEWAKRVRDVEAIESAVAAADDGAIRTALTAYIERIANERILAAQKTATLRSGARGKKARGVALKAEQTMLATVREEVYGTASESEAQVAARVLAVLYDELGKMDADSAEARARSILAGLDIDEETADGPVSALSGGWRMRVALAKAMFVRPDLLLLDECTNHLDLAAIAWLQDYLTTLDVTIVCVSHDRDFLNGVSQEIIRLSDKTLSYHPGNYDEYEQNEEELARKKQRQYDALQRRREHVQKSIERFMKHARSSNDDKVLGQVASRQKKLERMGAEKTEDGKRFKVSYWAGYHDTLRPEIVLKKAEASVDLKIPNAETLRGSGPLISLSSVSFSYPGRKRRVIKSVSLSIMPGDHIALLGLNGCGKSTLVQLLSGALTPTHGSITRHPALRIGHYTQHFVDELSSVRHCALDLLRIKAQKETEEAIAKGREATAPKEGDLRKWLGGFEVSGQLAIRPVNTMSGGQRARLAMALMLWERPHILLLDEITNHLDMYAVQGLVAALNDYEGTVVLVTHDRHFVRETADDVYVLEEGRIRLLEEGIDEYVAQFSR